MNLRLVLALLALLTTLPLSAAEGSIKKVLPFYLDAKGRNALSPSLFERDAYQVKLRNEPALRKALRMDVHFKTASTSTNLQLRLQLRSNASNQVTETTLTQPAQKTGFFGRWQSFKVEGTDFTHLGPVLAWRATLWEGDQMIAEQKSFLW